MQEVRPKSRPRRKREKGEDGEPALPDGPATPREQTSESDEVAPDNNNLTPPQAAQQTLEGSSEKVDGVNDLTLEGGEKVPADVELEEKADITPSPPAEASVIDNANSSESTNEGADSPTSSTDKDSTESVESTSVVEDQMGTSIDEGNLLAESAADTTVAGNVSAG